MSASHRFETYIAGAIMLLLGFLLIAFLLGLVTIGLVPPLFLIGLGIIFLIMALMKSTAPTTYETPPKTTVAYGTVILVIGVLWASLSVATQLAGFLLAILLILFGLVFLAYSRIKHSSI